MLPDALPPVTFSLGMASTNGSPPHLVLFFDDGVAVSMHSVRALAIELGLALPHRSVFEILHDWDRAFPALMELVQELAYGERAQGHRGNFITDDLLYAERLLPETRQIFRLTEHGPMSLPVTVQTAATASVALDKSMQKARANFCLAAIVGRICSNVDETQAHGAMAGWTLATEIVRPDGASFARRSSPGSLVIGPVMVPAAFAGDLRGIEYVFALMGKPVSRGDLGALAGLAPQAISSLSHDCLLVPGDIVLVGPEPSGELPEAGSIDVVDAMASGFGHQKISLS